MSVAVIVGAGHAGAECAFALRQQKFEGRIVLIGDEPSLPYKRPPLSKHFLAGEVEAPGLLIRAANSYEQQAIECLTGCAVTRIDAASRTVHLSDGRQLEYSKLVLATGGRARPLPLTGADKPNVHVLRTVADAERIKADFVAGARLIVIGGGFIGLEAAACAIKVGLHVTVGEALPRVLARVAVPELSAFFEQAHIRRGVRVLTGIGVRALEGNARVETVVLDDGTRLDADVVIAGIGMIPNTELAAATGLQVDQGIVVDAFAQTSDPHILAIGDCARHENAFLARRSRLESVPHAMEHARTAAATICGRAAPYSAVPWFWSDQFDLKLQMVGLSEGHDRMVMRGSLQSESFCLFHLKDGVLISADAVNRSADFGTAKQLVAQRARPDPQQLADDSTPLKSLLPSA